MRTLALLGGCMALTGCAKNFTRERFDMIKVGADDRREVRHVLGKPNGDLQEEWYYEDLDEHYSALIHFDRDGRVSGKQWLDAGTAEWNALGDSADPGPAGEPGRQKKRFRHVD